MPDMLAQSRYHAGLLALSFLRQVQQRTVTRGHKAHRHTRVHPAPAMRAGDFLKFLQEAQITQAMQPMDVIDALRDGLPGNTVELVEDALDMNTKELSVVLDREDKTVRGWGRKEKLDQTASEKLFRLLKGFTAAVLVLDDVEAAVEYLKTPSEALGNQRPLDLLATGEGETLVLTELGRAEYGLPV